MEAMVFLILGTIGMAVGTVAAVLAEKFPSHQALIERWSGDVLVGGLALVGCAFPIV